MSALPIILPYTLILNLTLALILSLPLPLAWSFVHVLQEATRGANLGFVLGLGFGQDGIIV